MLHGAGIGRAVVREAVDAYRGMGEGPVLLECISALEPFYERFGFRISGRFARPVADDLVLMLLEG